MEEKPVTIAVSKKQVTLIQEGLRDLCSPLAATSFRLPVPHKRVFEFLRDKNSRNKWDILRNGDVQEMAHIANGRDAGNCNIYREQHARSAGELHVLIQRHHIYVRSVVVYAPVDALLSGSNPNYVAMLPSGFATILKPDRRVSGDTLHWSCGASEGPPSSHSGASKGLTVLGLKPDLSISSSC